MPFVSARRGVADRDEGVGTLAGVDLPAAVEAHHAQSTTLAPDERRPRGAPVDETVAISSSMLDQAIAVLAQEVSKAVQSPEVVKFLTTGGFDPDGRSPAEFARFVKAESQRLGEVLRNAKFELK